MRQAIRNVLLFRRAFAGHLEADARAREFPLAAGAAAVLVMTTDNASQDSNVRVE